MEETRFLYSVYPQRPIKGILPNNRPINGPRSLSLTKKEVLTCLKFGTVYRRFANEGKNERVTVSNIDRLHNERFIMEKDYVVDSLGKDSGTVVDTAPEGKTSEKTEDKEIEETKVENTPDTEADEEVTEGEKAEEDVDSTKSVAEDEAEAVEEVKESTEPQVVISNNNNFNNGKKKKHH